MTCACEMSPSGTVVSLCGAHAQHLRNTVEMAKHPKGTILDKPLRDSLLVASIPNACERIARGDKVDRVAEQIEDLIHQIMRRLQ